MADTVFFIVAQGFSDWLNQVGRLEEPAMHFAIALLGVAGLIVLWCAARRNVTASSASWVCMAFGAVCLGFVAAVASQREYAGLRAEQRIIDEFLARPTAACGLRWTGRSALLVLS